MTKILDKHRKIKPSYTMIIFGALWCVLCAMVIYAFNTGSPNAKGSMEVAAVAFFIGLAIIFFGIKTKREEVTIVTKDEASYSSKAAFSKKKEWTEKIENYDGVMLVPRQKTVRKDHSVTVFDITLIHKNKDLEITLETLKNNTESRKPIEAYANTFQLPVLEELPGGKIVEREVEELDETIHERISKGNFNRTFRSSEPFPGKRYKLETLEGGIRLSRNYYVLRTVGFILLGSGIATLIFTGAPIGFSLAVVVCGGFMTASGFSKEILEASNGKIVYAVRLFGNEFGRKEVDMLQVEDISIRSNPAYGNVKSMNQAVKVSSDDAEFFIAQYTPEIEREWIADKLIELCLANSQ